MLPDFRLHFAVWANVQACSDGAVLALVDAYLKHYV